MGPIKNRGSIALGGFAALLLAGGITLLVFAFKTDAKGGLRIANDLGWVFGGLFGILFVLGGVVFSFKAWKLARRA